MATKQSAREQAYLAAMDELAAMDKEIKRRKIETKKLNEYYKKVRLHSACGACGKHNPVVDCTCRFCGSGTRINIASSNENKKGLGLFYPDANFSRARELLRKGEDISTEVCAELDRVHNLLARRRGLIPANASEADHK